ncbi:Hypothetical predicted protein [Pelobates cultripes]|uniref:Uncharacterized protein n=1 Tax=Pelobates cultripes TaxID=61616 RepID=A0AAD1S8V5_PELCU|nr:Hypothetical predicted protein [Pelobates cultripes]
MSQQSGPMDEFLSTPHCMAGTRGLDKMAPGSPGSSSRASSTQDSPRRDALTQMSVELAAISANMLTRQDKKELVAELRLAIREEVAAVRQDLTALEHRVDELEVQRLQAEQHQRATDLATSRQERAHRALRPPRRDGLPRDLVCCFQSFQLKETIMRAARTLRTINYMDSHVSLVDNRWLAVRWPNDVPRFLRAAGLPEIPVPNWILDNPPTRPTGPTVPAENQVDGVQQSSSTRRDGPSAAEE